MQNAFYKMISLYRKAGWLLVLGLFISSSVFGQFYNGSQLSFGKNRVQYQKFNWQYFRTNQFDVYFYPTGKSLAEYTLYKAPQFIEEIEKMLNFSASKKIQFIIYNTQSDFRESNFAYDDADFYNQGGVTNIYGTKVYLYFDGNHAHLDRMIRSGIMNIYAHLLVQGQSVGSNISSESLLSVPNWYYSGLSSFIGEKWNSVLDAHVKDGILTQRYAAFDELSPVDATYAGHSFWKFVVDRYGENAISNILYATRSSKSYEKGFYYVTGVEYKKLLVDWYRYYYVIYKKDTKRTMPEGDGFLKKTNKARDYNQLCLSPNGESFAYVTNQSGQIKIWLHTSDMKKPKMIYRRYQKIEDNPDLTFPLLAWHPTGEILGFTLEDRGRCYYYPFVIESNKLEKRLLVDVEKISDWSYSEDGKMMLFSGFKNGQSDIFLYSFLSRSFQYITQDIYDDYAPRFINHQRQIVFSSNRDIDSLNTKLKFYNVKPQNFYDLFLYQYDKKDEKLLRITHTPYANETAAREVNAQEIIFLSDENGIINRKIAHLDSTISKIDTVIHYVYYAKSQNLTDNAYSILEQDYNPTTNQLAEIMLYKGVKRIYFSDLNLTSLPQLTSSSFQEQIKLDQQKRDSIAAVKRVKSNVVQIKRGFYQVRKSDIVKSVELDSVGNSNFKKGFQPNAATQGIDYIQPITKNYYVQYSLNKLVTQADFSFLNTSYQQFTGGASPVYLNTGFNALVMVGINDLFENRRITGGFRLSFDLESNEFMLSYENLSRRIDHQVVVYRQSIKSSIGGYSYKQHSNSIFYIMKLPFNKINSVRLTLTGRYETYIMSSLNDYSLQKKDENHLWAGVKLEYIYDSSKELFTNLWRGTKFKVFAEYEHRLEKDQKNLLVVGFDFRKSFKLYKNMTFALRMAGSGNVGSARLVYYMGGLDNWMFAKFNSDIWVDQTKDYAYQTLATNMRGFKQNIRNGTSFVLLNAELRVPFVQLIAQKKMGSYFLNSLQLLLFGDYGTAWTGLTPYSKENCLYTRYVTSGPITVKVKRQVDPFVGGFGLGLRAALFGYFLRLDYAWGVENYKINEKGMFTFSVGVDF